MAGLLVVLFIVVPILELAAINQVQAVLGWPATIIILVLDSIVGAYLVRLQGVLAWRRFTQSLGTMRLPAEEIVDGALILFGGALLLTPGFLTDITGLAMVFTPSRKLLNRFIRTRIESRPGSFGGFLRMGRAGRGKPTPPPEGPKEPKGPKAAPRPRPRPSEPGVIDVEVVDVRRTPRLPGTDRSRDADGDPAG